MPRLRPIREVPKEPTKANTALDGLFGAREAEEQTANDENKADLKKEEAPVVDKPQADSPDEATVRLQKQIDDLKKSEEIQRTYAERMAREREDALRLARDNAKRLEEVQRESQEQEETAVGAALAAAKAEADKAQSDYITALNAGDNAAAAEAQRRMARAEARVDRLELGKEEIEARKKAPPKAEERPIPAAPATGDPVDAYNLPDDCKVWLKTHRDYITDQRKAIDLDRAHRLAGLEGLSPGNPKYLPFIEGQLFPTEKEPAVAEGEEPATERASIVSAPVSREAPSGGNTQRGRIRLTQDQKEAAKMAGITEVEYAKQLQKLQEEKNTGNYAERRYG